MDNFPDGELVVFTLLSLHAVNNFSAGVIR